LQIKEKQGKTQIVKHSRNVCHIVQFIVFTYSTYLLTYLLWSDRVRRFGKKFAECDNIFGKISVSLR